MHIPDGVLSPEVCGVTGAISAAAVGYSLYKLRDSLADRTVPLTGMMAAMVFAAQMVNFPIALVGVPAYSGHLMGGVLAAAILGPWAGCLAITLVLIVQFFLFADGGMLALGANVLNMAVVGALGGYAVLATVRRWLGGGNRGTLAGVIVAAWLSVMAAASLFCLEFYLSHRTAEFEFSNIFTLMVTFHSAIGVGEALITGGVISFVILRRPDLIDQPESSQGLVRVSRNLGRTTTVGFVVALAVAAFLAPFASSHADGLEAVGEQKFKQQTEQQQTEVVFGGYEFPLPVPNWEQSPVWQKISVSLAGLLGTSVVLVIALSFDRSLTRRSRNQTEVRNQDSGFRIQ